MSHLDDAMQEHMAFIVFSEQRPFSYRDFLSFKVNEKDYRMAHGTFRNKISNLQKSGEVELSYYSINAYYTLKGHKFAKSMTPNHTGVSSNGFFYRFLQDLPLDRQSIHDIHMKFKLSGIWLRLSTGNHFHITKRSSDIVIPAWVKNNVIVKVAIHKTDTVSITLGCSLEPICLDTNGIIRFFSILAKVGERLQMLIESGITTNHDIKNYTIPEYEKWIVTMWHFGRDSLTEFSGERFSITIEDAKHTLLRLYAKDSNGRNKLRVEKQEYPQKPLSQVLEEQLNKI